MKETSYRKFYKHYYQIDFASEIEIHHIDFNRNNNSISNLVALPKELHNKYHRIVCALCDVNDLKNKSIDIKLSNTNITDYNYKAFSELPYVILECQKWLCLKRNNYLYIEYANGLITRREREWE